MGAQPMGAPGWPELAFWTMSAVRQRTVLMHFQLMSLLSNLGSNFCGIRPSVPRAIGLRQLVSARARAAQPLVVPPAAGQPAPEQRGRPSWWRFCVRCAMQRGSVQQREWCGRALTDSKLRWRSRVSGRAARPRSQACALWPSAPASGAAMLSALASVFPAVTLHSRGSHEVASGGKATAHRRLGGHVTYPQGGGGGGGGGGGAKMRLADPRGGRRPRGVSRQL